MSNPLGHIFGFVLKLFLGLLAAVFAVSLLAATLLLVTFSLLKSLITGRKPASTMAFGHFRQFSSQGMWPAGRARQQPAASAGNIVDVEVREIREDRRLP